MFRPVSIFIGLRYTRAKKRNHFVSFISLTSMLGIALGVAVLITVLSVMNGFDEEIHKRIFEMAPQIVIRNEHGKIDNWPEIVKKATKISGVIAAAPFVAGQGMLTHEGTVVPAVITGIIPSQEKQISELNDKMAEGTLAAIKPGTFNIVLGKGLAENLGLSLGDMVTLITPQAASTPLGIVPRFKRFTVAGIFDAGKGFGFDNTLGFISITDAQALYQMGSSVTAVRLKLKDFYAAPAISEELISILPEDYIVTNWTQEFGAFFNILKLEKNMMFLMLLLIVAVATFNLVSTLVMVVNDKQADIAILRTFGATPRTILSIFIVQGFVVGVIGIISGVIGGIFLAHHVTEVVRLIETYSHVKLVSADAYYLNYLPSKLSGIDVRNVCLAAFILCLLATLYPAWRASRTQPAEALRYE